MPKSWNLYSSRSRTEFPLPLPELSCCVPTLARNSSKILLASPHLVLYPPCCSVSTQHTLAWCVQTTLPPKRALFFSAPTPPPAPTLIYSFRLAAEKKKKKNKIRDWIVSCTKYILKNLPAPLAVDFCTKPDRGREERIRKARSKNTPVHFASCGGGFVFGISSSRPLARVSPTKP